MTERSATRAWISQGLQEAGLRGRGAIWRLKGLDVQWVVHIDELPFGNRFGIDIGLDLQLVTTPRRPTDCPVLLHLENLPVARDLEVVASLDLDSGMSSDRRRQELDRATAALGDYIGEHITMGAVRAAYRNGDFASAFIHKDARAMLESGEVP